MLSPEVGGGARVLRGSCHYTFTVSVRPSIELMWILYQFALSAVSLLAAPFLLIARGRHYLPTLPGRLGLRCPPGAHGALWLHAVSVGEVGVATILARSLPPELPLLVTTVTPTGQARAREALAGRAIVTYLPFDLRWIVEKFLRRFEPRALVLCEGDLWPLALHSAKRRGLPIVVVNGRVSDRGFRRLRRLGRLRAPLLAPVDHFAVQSHEDARRLESLGVEKRRLSETGNLKFEAAPANLDKDLDEQICRAAAGRPILVAGSTMEGEEQAVLEAFAAIGGGERALLILAPRHPERWPQVSALLDGRGLSWAPRSALASARENLAVILLDSLGELAGIYSKATAAFIGGTLVPTGGHNPLEAAIWGVPVAIGPSMENFRDLAAQFDAAEAWERVTDGRSLASAWTHWIDDESAARTVGERGLALLTANRGALQRTLSLLRETLPLEPAAQGAEQSSAGEP